jgi:hypothetical protein
LPWINSAERIDPNGRSVDSGQRAVPPEDQPKSPPPPCSSGALPFPHRRVAGRFQPRLDHRILIVSPSHAVRPEVEACIRDVYEEAFGACGLSFPRRLVALLDDAGHPVCAAGLRTAKEGFFSEIYLDFPIEQVLQRQFGKPVARRRVFEVTTLASRTSETSPLFIRQLVLLGKIAGFDWSFFTATARLRKLLCQLGVPITGLNTAEPTRLPDADRWGTYYSHTPIVCAVNKLWLDDRALAPRKASSVA